MADLGLQRSFMVPATPEPEDEPDKQREAREATRTASRQSPHGYELFGPDGRPSHWVLTWDRMSPEARATACWLALDLRFGLDTRIMYFDPRTRIVFAVQPDPNVQGVRKGTGRPVAKSVEEAVVRASAAHGESGAAIRQFIKRRK